MPKVSIQTFLLYFKVLCSHGQLNIYRSLPSKVKYTATKAKNTCLLSTPCQSILQKINKIIVAVSPSPAGMSLNKLSPARNNYCKLFLAGESLVSDIPAGDGKTANLFLQCSTSEGGVEVLELGYLQAHHQFPGL